MIRRAVFLLLAAGVLVGGAVGSAQATGYRYWSFWERGAEGWLFATTGPSLARPGDGDVQGFRFAVSENSGDAHQPRGAADFEAICAKTPAEKGSKRVALVLDFGTAADAPSGETPPAPRTACAQVPPDATTADALAAVADPLRYDPSALLCAIAGYPKTGCGEQVAVNSAAPEPAPAEPDDGTTPSVGLIAGAALIATLAAAATWQARHQKNANR